MDKRTDVEQKAEKRRGNLNIDSKKKRDEKKNSSPISFLHMMTSREPEIKGVTDGPNQSCEEHDSQTNPQGTR